MILGRTCPVPTCRTHDLGPSMLIGTERQRPGGGVEANFRAFPLAMAHACPPTHAHGPMKAEYRRYQWVKRAVCECTDAPVPASWTYSHNRLGKDHGFMNPWPRVLPSASVLDLIEVKHGQGRNRPPDFLCVHRQPPLRQQPSTSERIDSPG